MATFSTYYSIVSLNRLSAKSNTSYIIHGEAYIIFKKLENMMVIMDLNPKHALLIWTLFGFMSVFGSTAYIMLTSQCNFDPLTSHFYL